MRGAAALVAGAAAGVVVMPLILAASISSSASVAQVASAPSQGTLNTAAVPPDYVGFVMQAAAMCPEESAPLIAAQIEAESGWNPNAVSPVGAMGIAQFMPGTWATWGKDYDANGTSSPIDPGDAIPAQGALMCALFARVKTLPNGTPEQNALAAYNAGFGNVQASGGFPTGILETDAYVPRIEALKAKYTAAGGGAGLPAGPGAAGAIAAAQRYLGYPYVWGGGDTNGPTGYLWGAGPPVGFDCEGLTRYAIYQGYHVDIGAGSTGQLATPAMQTVVNRLVGQPLPLDQMAPGDVVVINFHPSPDGAWGHVALYIGNGQFIHAPHTGAFVEIVPATDFANGDWAVRRVP